MSPRVFLGFLFCWVFGCGAEPLPRPISPRVECDYRGEVVLSARMVDIEGEELIGALETQRFWCAVGDSPQADMICRLVKGQE